MAERKYSSDRKTFIDSLFINYDASQFAEVVKLYIKDKLGGETENLPAFSPLVRSNFKQQAWKPNFILCIIFMNRIFSRMAF